jgi:hypothetical protein
MMPPFAKNYEGELCRNQWLLVADSLYLAEVTLVDREAVRFLAACNVREIGLRNCPGFIREWVARGKDVGHG